MSADPTISAPKTELAAIPSRKPRWWYSRDERRGFCWAEMTAYDFRAGGVGSHLTSTLYLYVKGGIVHLNGAEADEVYAEIKKR